MKTGLLRRRSKRAIRALINQAAGRIVEPVRQHARTPHTLRVRLARASDLAYDFPSPR